MPVGDFAQTKIQPPRPRAGLLARDRLASPIATAVTEYPLTLLCAPAGFGKTVLLTQQLARWPADQPLVWIALDEDDDLTRLADCLVSALEPYDVPWRVAPEALVADIGNRPGATAALATDLVNALAGVDTPRGVMVIDDLHRTQDAAVFEFLERLIERLPRQWGVVLATRVEPPLPLARWRARGQLAEWRQDALRFTASEVSTLAATRGRDDAQALLDRTGGWAAGLGLLLDARREPGARVVQDRAMFDFLAAEVLDQMPVPLRTFLLDCSVLPELSATRCAQVSDQPDAARWLEEIERRGLFVTVVDEQEPTLRLHDLFRDFLEDRLRRERPHDWPRLLARAAAGEGDVLRRVGYLLRAGAWADAETALVLTAPERIAAGATLQVRRLIEGFPAAWRDESPALQELRGLCAWSQWDWTGAAEAMGKAAAGFARGGQQAQAQRVQLFSVIRAGSTANADDWAVVGPQLDAIAAQSLDDENRILLAVARAWRHLGACEADRVARPYAEAVALLDAGAAPWLRFACMPPTTFLGLYGIRPALARYVAGALASVPEDPPAEMGVMAEALQAGLELFADRAETALPLLERVAEAVRWMNSPRRPITYLHIVGGFVHAVLGRADPALAASQRLLDLLDEDRGSGRHRVWWKHTVYLQLRVAAVLDDAQVQREAAAKLRGGEDPAEPALYRRQRGALAARLAALDGRWRDAASGFELALRDEAALNHYGQAGELRVRWAHALVRDGRIDAAAAALRPAFERAEESGEPGPMRLAGPAALAELADVRWNDRLSPEHQAWLRAAAARPTPTPNAAFAGAALSSRELEVLAQMADGQSNKLIARTLGLSPHTVKRHVANILDKLDLASRQQAASWYREHRR